MNKNEILTTAIELTKIVAVGHQHPSQVLEDLYRVLLKLQAEAQQ